MTKSEQTSLPAQDHRSGAAGHLVLHANTSWYVKRFYSELVQALLEDGHQVSVIVPDTEHKLEHLGIKVHILPMKRAGTNPYHDALYYMRLVRLLRHIKPTALLNFTVKPNIYGGMAAARLRIPAINTISGIGSSLLGRGPVFYVVRQLYRAASRSTTNVYLNKSDMAFFAELGVRAEKQIMIPGAGVNLEEFKRSSPPTSNNTFLYLGRLIRDKGINEYLDAAKKLHSKDVRFIVGGETDPGNPTSLDPHTVADLHRSGIIEHLGFVQDVRQLLENIDCLVLPSYAEGLSRVMLEAAAMEVGLIASDVPGCREIAPPGTGTLVSPGSTEELVVAIKAYIDMNNAQKDQAKSNARTHVANQFSVETVIEKYRELLP